MGVAVDHRSFVIERRLPGRPAHAFRFFAELPLKRRWTSCHPSWTVLEDRLDFSVGGSEVTRWRMPDGTVQEMAAHFLEIHPAERIVYAYVMRTAGVPISSSLVTIELLPAGETTRMVYTEQAVFGDPRDGDIREAGTGIGFDRLVEALAAEEYRDLRH